MKKLLILFWIGILSIPNLFPVVFRNEAGLVVNALILGLISLLILLSFFQKIYLGFLLSLPLFLLWIPSVYLRTVYETPITREFVGMALETNRSEVVNLFSIFEYKYFFLTLAMVLIWLILVFFAKKTKIEWIKKYRLIVLCLGTLFIFFYAFIGYAERNYDNLISNQDQDPFQDLMDVVFLRDWQMVYPSDFLIAMHQAVRDSRKNVTLRQGLDGFKFNGFRGEQSPDIIVLVIGESSRKDKWGIYGYDRDTTPRLRGAANLIKIEDVVSISSATRSAVPAIVSRRPYYGPDGISGDAELSILKAFSEAGYYTSWFSNQSSSGFYDGPLAFYAKDADKLIYTNASGFSSRGAYDSVLIPLFEKQIDEGARHQFIVLHTMGSHFNYSYRFPEDFEKFTPSLRVKGAIRKEEVKNSELIKNSYDNSIFYTDFILGEIIKKLSSVDKKALLVYSSDHGEDLIGDSCEYDSIRRVSSKSFEIPVFFWFNEQAKNSMPEVYNKLFLNSKIPITAKFIPQTLLDAAGVNVGGVPTDSLLRDDFVANKLRRVYSIGGWVDFDFAKSKDACHIFPN